MPVDPYGGIQQRNIKRNFRYYKHMSHIRQDIRIWQVIQVQIRTNATTFFKLQPCFNLPSILGTRNNRNAGSETRTFNRLSLVNHEQDWAAISDRGDTDIHGSDIAPICALTGY